MGNAQSRDTPKKPCFVSNDHVNIDIKPSVNDIGEHFLTNNQSVTSVQSVMSHDSLESTNQNDTNKNEVRIEVIDESIPCVRRANSVLIQESDKKIKLEEEPELEYILTYNNYHKYNHEIVMKYDIKKKLDVHNPNDVMDSTIIVDETGSMRDMGEEPIDSVNEYIKVQRDSGFPVKIRIIRFAQHISIKEGNVSDPGLNIDDYYPSGMTALFDAVIFGILYDVKPQHMIILTDGKDNTSVRTLRELNELIQRAESCGWKFTFIGCNKEAYDQGSQFTMSSQPINIDCEGAPPKPLLHAMRAASNNSATLNKEYSVSN